MNPTVYLYDETQNGYELYLGAYSILRGISLFDENTEISISRFTARSYESCDWMTKKDIPTLTRVGSLIQFLTLDEDMDIVDMEIELLQIGSISTNDDVDCHFVFRSKTMCTAIINAVLPASYADVLFRKMQYGLGKLFSCNQAGVVNQYDCFEDFIAS